MRIYFARPQNLYGTPQDNRDKLALQFLGLEVVDPNTPEMQESYKEHGMETFFRLVNTCNALAFRAFPDGRIPAGVWKEVEAARERGIPIIELPSILPSRSMPVDETRLYLGYLGQR
jgi:hypothetical protein